MNFDQDHFMTSNTFRSASERLRADTYRLVQERDQLTNKEQAHSSKNIGDRVSDIDFWKSELRHETDLLVGETNALTEVKIYKFYFIKITNSSRRKNGSSALSRKPSHHLVSPKSVCSIATNARESTLCMITLSPSFYKKLKLFKLVRLKWKDLSNELSNSYSKT